MAKDNAAPNKTETSAAELGEATTPATENQEGQQDTAKKASKKDSKFRWYVIQTQSNYEKRVQKGLLEQARLQGAEKDLKEVLIPTEEVVEVKKGVKSSSERKFFPGYVLIKANMTDKLWHVVKNIPRVTMFVGSGRGSKPLPISEREAERILKQMQEGVEKPRSLVTYEVGEEVRVNDGPFATFQGVVESVDEEKERLKVSVSIFGRSTPIDLDFVQVEKI